MKKREEEVNQAAEKLATELKEAGYRVKIDTRDLRPGAKYYYWEMRGVPLRLEVGPRDLDNGVVMGVLRTGGKESLPRPAIISEVSRKMTEYSNALLDRAENHIKDHLFMIRQESDVKDTVLKGVAAVHWCGNRKCADHLEEISDASILGTEVRTDLINRSDGNCIICGKPGSVVTLVGRSY